MRLLLVLFLLSLSISLSAQSDSTITSKVDTIKKATKELPLEPGRKMMLKTTKGTWMSLDVSPNGQQIAFDLLGDIYILPIQGGRAKRIIGDLSFESHPKFSPDGKSICFTSDRSGSENIWIADITNLDSLKFEQITKDNDQNYQSAEWTPDGEYIVAAKGVRNLKLFLFHKDGGGGMQLISKPENLKTIEPSFGKNEQYIWISQRNGDWSYNAQMPEYQLATYDRETGELETKTSRYGSAFAPTLSPDGQWLVYGTRHNTQTGLVRRNLQTGEENWLAYPVQRDEQESRARLGVYPSMSFTPDSKRILVSYGGGIHAIDMTSGQARQIPFEVNETIDYGPELRFDYPVSDDSTFEITQIRDPRISPDGKKISFSALNRLYVADYPYGTPSRISDHTFTEAMPTWSPDSRSIAFVSWENEGGHIYVADLSTGVARLKKLTTKEAFYSDPNWDFNTNRIIFTTGSAQSYVNAIGPFAFGATEELAWIDPISGGITSIGMTHGRTNAHFVKGSERIYLNHPAKGLISVRWDDSDEKQHVKISGITTYPALHMEQHCMLVASETEPAKKPSDATLITMHPDGKTALALINNEIYTVAIPTIGGEIPSINVSNPQNSSFPSRKLTEIGGEWPHWTGDGHRVIWSLGNSVFDYHINDAVVYEKEQKKLKALAVAAKKDSTSTTEKIDSALLAESYHAKEYPIKVMAERDVPVGKLLLTNARILSMSGEGVIENGDIYIVNNRIKAVGASGTLQVDTDAETINMTGKTISPGFVDTHAHMWPNWGLHKNEVWIYAANLAYGVTTTRDPQTATTDVLTYEDMVEAGQILGPRIYSTGPGVGFWSYRIKDQKHADRVLEQYSKYYDTKTIKMYMAGNRQERQWIIKAAKEQNIMPTTEGGLDFKLNMTQILDGYPGHEHALPIYPIYDDVLQLLVESGVAVTPTLLVAYGGPWAENYFYSRHSPQYDKKLNYFTPKAELDAKSRRRPGWFMDEEHVFQKHAETARQIVEKGGTVGVGSHGQLQGLGYHWELWAVASGGMSTLDAMRTATILGARAIGLEKDLGSIEAGKLADLVIMEKNPLEDIHHTNTITHVMKNGRLYIGDNLDEIYPRQINAGTFFDSSDIPSTNLPGIQKR